MIYKYKNLTDYPIVEVLDEFKETKKVTGTFHLSFFKHALAYISNSCTLVRTEAGKISPSETYARMGKDNNELGKQLVSLFYQVSRSQLIALKLTDRRVLDYNTAVPLFMSAYKLYDDIGYEEWDKEDKFIKYFLGKPLEGLYELDDWELPSDFDIDQARIDSQTSASGAKAGETEPPTSYKFNTAKWTPTITRKDMIGRMTLQTWAYNVEYRHDKMILDPWNWDNMPEAYDIRAKDILDPATVYVQNPDLDY
jgi:hypothetical protein